VAGRRLGGRLVTRLHRQIARFADEAGTAVVVELELPDGALLRLDSISPEPGYGFVTVRPGAAPGEPLQEIVLPLGAFSRLTLSPAEERPAHFGFTLPEP
jgi:hypothetical protein